MNKKNRTEISTLGEFALIDKIAKVLPLKHSTSLCGVGDDAAVIASEEHLSNLLTQELLLEGIHFDLTYTPLKHLGYKAVVVAISDIYAMNGEPRQLLVGIGVSARFSVEDIEELYSGIYLACEHYGVDLVGGDTTSSLTGLSLSLTVIGVALKEKITYRSGAKATDLICVTGDLGAAYMGLQLLEREKRVFAGVEGEFTPAFEGREYILERQLRPQLKRHILGELAQRGVKPSAMMDISDGLASELMHIAKASAVGVRIYEDRLPIDYETAAMAEEFGLNVSTVALNGGDDYEFVLTIPLGQMDLIKDIEGLHVIGHITEDSLGACLVARDGTEIELVAQGWKQ